MFLRLGTSAELKVQYTAPQKPLSDLGRCQTWVWNAQHNGRSRSAFGAGGKVGAMREPQWARVYYGPIDYQDIYYYSAPKRKALASLDEVDPEILKTYDNTPVRAAAV